MTILRDFHVVRIAQDDIDLMDELVRLDRAAPGIWREKFQLAMHEDPKKPTEIVWRDGSTPTRGREAVVDALAPALRRWWNDAVEARAREAREAELAAEREKKGDEKAA